MSRTALVAIGGNSLITDKNNPDIPHQWDAVRETCRHLADMVEDKLETATTVANPFANMSVSSRVNSAALANDAPSLMIVTGLALRSFD